MRYSEISYTHLNEPSLFDTATLFVPRDRVEEFITILSLFKGRIIKTRVLSKGYSVDALVDDPQAAADLLLAWTLQSTSRRPT
jgi:hypothetical protein